MWSARIGITVTFAMLFLGCAPSPSSPPAVAARSGQYGPRPTRWEQFCEQASSVAQASWLVGSRGADGWELAAMYNGVLCYKRPELPGTPSPGAFLGGSGQGQQRLPPQNGQETVPQILEPGF